MRVQQVVCLLLLGCALCSSLSLKPDITRRKWCKDGLLFGSALAAAFARVAPSTADSLMQEASQSPYLMKEYFDPPVTAPWAGRLAFPALTPPFRRRATYRYNLGRNAWALEQLLSFANVTATIRSNVILLESGGLWVHSPQYPTGELCQLLDDLGHPVEHAVLPCNALEHKAPVKSFLKRYPEAAVWISPGQYGPLGSCGTSIKDELKMGYRVDGIFGECSPPWADEFDVATLYVDIPKNAGPVSEVAFCHRPTQTLVATDAVVFVPGGPRAPDIFSTYFDEETVDNPTFWPKSVLQAVFLPLRTDKDGAYPGFEAIQNRLIRAPILRAFADARAPNEVKQWILKIGQWKFDRIVTSHFASPIAATPKQFCEAYAYLFDEGEGVQLDHLPPVACQDWELLESLNKVIAENELGAPTVFDYKRQCDI